MYTPTWCTLFVRTLVSICVCSVLPLLPCDASVTSTARYLPTSQDPNAHVKFLKPSPSASPLVDRCIECGFCESNCPSRDLTLSPRQRIAAYKEINRLRGIAPRSAAEEARLQQFEQVRIPLITIETDAWLCMVARGRHQLL